MSDHEWKDTKSKFLGIEKSKKNSHLVTRALIKGPSGGYINK